MNTEKELTPKQKYDKEIKEINDTIAPKSVEEEAGLSSEDVEELEAECEAVEEAMDMVDKSMGDVKESTTSTMTKDQHLQNKVNEQRDSILSKFTGVGAKQEGLKPSQQKTMTKVLELIKSGKIDDPVLKHLVAKKLDLATEQAVLSTEIKEVQLNVITQMANLADATMKNKGAVDHYNRDILVYVQKNPSLLAE